MTTPRSPVDQALDMLLFAPLGLAAVVAEHLPDLADRGRQHWGSQATMAKVVGQFAVGRGRKEASSLLRRVGDLLGPFVARPTPTPPAPPRATPSAPAGPEPSSPATAQSTAGSDSADDLAIPGYDALSAPQVVSRLDGLSAEELEAVRAYEAGTRGRRTVLGRVAQLQAMLN